MPVTSVTPDLDSLTLTIHAEFAAPPQRIWDMYADARQLEQVWGPPGYPATFVDHELTVGNRSTYYMTGPEGQKFCGYWVITAVDEPHMFAVEDGFADADFKPLTDMPASEMVFRFETAPAGTKATFVSTYANREGLEKVLAMGVVEGATAAINQIDGFLAG